MGVDSIKDSVAARGDGGGGAGSDEEDDRFVLVLVNPKSGTGHSTRMLRDQLEPLLRLYKIKYEVVVTTQAGHAHELVSSASDSTLSRWLAVVCVSGDGLVYEVYNALYARQRRWEAKRKQALEDGEGGGREGISNAPLLTPIGLMPGGSGCALNCSLLRYLGQPLDGLNNLGPSASARNVALGCASSSSPLTAPLDLMEVDLANGERLVSFLGVTLGVIADGDIGTEWMRCVGFLRTYLYIGFRTMFPAPYKVRVSYLPLEKEDDGRVVPARPGEERTMPKLGEPLPDGERWVTEVDRYHVVYALNLSMLDPMTLFAPDSRPGDGVMWLVLVRGRITRMQLIKWFTALQEGPDPEAVRIGALACIPIRAFRFEPLDPPPPAEGATAPGILSLDAESVHFGAVQGRTVPRAARLLVAEQDEKD